MRSFPARLTAANSPRFLSCTWVYRSHEWSRRADELESWIIRKKKAVVNHASATQSSHAGWRYREGNSSFSGPTPQSLGVCAAFFCDQARSNWDSVTSATQFHCPRLYSEICTHTHARARTHTHTPTLIHTTHHTDTHTHTYTHTHTHTLCDTHIHMLMYMHQHTDAKILTHLHKHACSRTCLHNTRPHILWPTLLLSSISIPPESLSSLLFWTPKQLASAHFPSALFAAPWRNIHTQELLQTKVDRLKPSGAQASYSFLLKTVVFD